MDDQQPRPRRRVRDALAVTVLYLAIIWVTFTLTAFGAPRLVAVLVGGLVFAPVFLALRDRP